MNQFKYKTNINCGNCIKTVTPFLDSLDGATWDVDVTTKDKVLSVSGANIDSNEVKKKVKEAGFSISDIKKNPLKFW